MKKLKFLSLALLTGVLSCTAQKSEQRTLANYTKIDAGGALTILYTQSDSIMVEVSAKENELSRVETKVENGVLYIHNTGSFSAPVTITIKGNNLRELVTSGSVAFKSVNAIKTTSLQIDATGASNIQLKSETQYLKTTASGASNLVLSGSTDELTTDLTGASSLNSYGLISKSVNVSTTGASKAKVYASTKAVANAGGASTIKIKGDPINIVTESTPAATITKVNKPISDSDKSGNDSTIFNWKGKKVIVINEEDKLSIKKDIDFKSNFKHWKGFAWGVNGYFNANGGTNMLKPYQFMELNYPTSDNFQFNLMERQFNLSKNYVKLVTGFGFDYHMYSFANKTKLNADSSFTWGNIDSTNNFGYSKNKLRCTYLQVPLLLEFNTSNNPDKAFHIAFGVIGQYLIASRTKQVVEQNKYEITTVRKDSYNLSPFAAKAHVNLGYRGWTIYAEYSLTRLFESGKGPELYPFAVGLRMLPFS